MRLFERIARFMMGRNGSDRLNYFILCVTAVLSLINIFTRSLIVSTVTLTLMCICIFRTFSKNLYARRRENQKYVTALSSFRNSFKLLKNKFKDRKTHVYRKCTKCKATLRLSKKKGKHTVVYPRCNERFDVKI